MINTRKILIFNIQPLLMHLRVASCWFGYFGYGERVSLNRGKRTMEGTEREDFSRLELN